MTRIIGMTGRRGSKGAGYVQAQAGKDTAAERLISRFGYVKIALADGVRDSLYALNPVVELTKKLQDVVIELGWDQATVLYPQIDDMLLLSTNQGLDRIRLYHSNPTIRYTKRLTDLVDAIGWEQAKRTPEVRALMQRMGTEAGRDVHGESLWTDLVERKIGRLPEGTPVVVTDVRFPNEEEWLRSLGGIVIEVFRPEELQGDLGDNAKHASETMGWIDPDHVLVNDGTIEQLHEKVDMLLAEIEGSR